MRLLLRLRLLARLLEGFIVSPLLAPNLENTSRPDLLHLHEALLGNELSLIGSDAELVFIRGHSDDKGELATAGDAISSDVFVEEIAEEVVELHVWAVVAEDVAVEDD